MADFMHKSPESIVDLRSDTVTQPVPAIEAALKPDDPHFARTRLLTLEDTRGGNLLPFDYIEQAVLWTSDDRSAAEPLQASSAPSGLRSALQPWLRRGGQPEGSLPLAASRTAKYTQ